MKSAHETILGLHWHHFGQAILPPMIPDDVPTPKEVSQDGPVLVYLGFESLEAVVQTLRRIHHSRFRVYSRESLEHNHPNVEAMPIRLDSFLRDLARTRGVICNTVFSLISEALHLGKRVLTMPVRHQTGLESKARALDILGLARVFEQLHHESLDQWLAFPSPEPMCYPDVVTPVIHWIEAGHWNDPQSLPETLWTRVNFPVKQVRTIQTG